MDFRIKQIIEEANTRSSEDINEAIRFLIKKIKKSDDIEKKIENIKKMKGKKKEEEEKKLLDYLHKKYLLQEEKRKKDEEIRKRKEAVFQEKMRLHDLKEKLNSIDWEYIKEALNDYILLSLNDLLKKNYNITESSNNDVYTFYTQLRKDINEQFTDLYKSGINYFFTSQYDFKPSAELFKLDELQGIISQYKELKNRNSGISIDIAKQLLETTEKSNKEANLILAIKIAHSSYKDYIDELEENFKTLRQEFKGSIRDELIYVALYSSNNYIDSAREFLEAKNNNNNNSHPSSNNNNSHPSSNNNNSPQPTQNQETTNFSQGIQQLTSEPQQTEFHLLEEYDEIEKNLHESQRNYILYNNDRYDPSDFIRDSLNDDELYKALQNLYKNSKNNQDISFMIGNMDLAVIYRSKIVGNIHQLKKKIIKYKIFESFCGKPFSREIFSNNSIDFRRIYQSNGELHDIFIQLILFFNDNSELSQIDLRLFLEIIACVIVFYYVKRRDDSTTIETILTQGLSGLDLKKAQDYIVHLRKLLNTKESLSDEEYFKLFGRIRTKISKRNNQQASVNAADRAKKRLDEAALRYLEQRNKQKQGTRSTQIIGAPIKQTGHRTSDTQIVVSTKEKATDEDKSQIIMKAFENMNNRDSVSMPLLGFNEIISFGKKSINFENQEETTEINTITTLKTIYAKNIPIIERFFELLNQLSQLIKINNKNKDNYRNIAIKVRDLINILNQMSGIFTTSISNPSLKSDINILLSSIIENLTKNIGAYYDDEYQVKFPKKREELTNEEINEYLLILEIDDKIFSRQSPEVKRKYIDRQYKKLAMEKHTNKKAQSGINDTNNNEFQKVEDAKNKLMLFYEPEPEKPNNLNNQTNYNTSNFDEFKKKYLKANPRFMPVASSAENYVKRLKLIKKAYKEYKAYKNLSKNNIKKYLEESIKFMPVGSSEKNKVERLKLIKEYKNLKKNKNNNLLDILIEKIHIQRLSGLNLDSLDSLDSLFKLFSPFNILYNYKFTETTSIFGHFILLVDNDIVIRFNAGISSRDYLELCSNIDKYIKYILNDETFINGTIDNRENFKQSVYYNFFLNLRSIIEIILKYLTDKDPRYNIFFKIKKALDNIIQKIHELDTDKKLSIFKTKKNQSGVLFIPNKFNFRKTGQEQKRELKGKIMKEIDELFYSSKNSLNKLYNSKKNKTDEEKNKTDEEKNEEKKKILLDEFNKLLKQLIDKYNISFEEFVKGEDNDIEEIIKSFFKKLNTDLGENYSESDVNDLITTLLKSKSKSNFLKKKILTPVIIKLVDRLIGFGAKKLKDTILELLYIIVISFTSERQLSQNIKLQKKDIRRVNNSSHALLTRINEENKKTKMALIVLQRLQEKESSLEGTKATNEQKQKALDEELKKATKELRVSRESLAIVVGNRSTPLTTKSGKEFFNKLKTSLLLLEGPTQQPKPVVPKPANTSNLTYNSLTAKTKSNVVKKLQEALKDKGKAPRLEEIMEEINRNRPIGITTPKLFQQEIVKRFRDPFKIPHNDTQLITELSKKYINKKKTEGEQSEVLQKILRVIKQIKANKSLGITSIAQYKKEIQKGLSKNELSKKGLSKNELSKNELSKNELSKKKKEIKNIIQAKINSSRKTVSKVTNEEIETSIDDYFQNNDIQNKSYNDFIKYLFSKKTSIMEQVN